MSSIGSTLNSINSSLLSEISAFNNTKTSGNAKRASALGAPDQIDFSQSASLFRQLQQLQTSNPAEFKQVLSDAATKFQTAAKQTSDSTQASFLSSLAAQFQQAANSGDISGLKPPASAGGTYGAHHHRHHHNAGADITAASANVGTQNVLTSVLSSTQTTQPSNQVQNALLNIFRASA